MSYRVGYTDVVVVRRPILILFISYVNPPLSIIHFLSIDSWYVKVKDFVVLLPYEKIFVWRCIQIQDTHLLPVTNTKRPQTLLMGMNIVTFSVNIFLLTDNTIFLVFRLTKWKYHLQGPSTHSVSFHSIFWYQLSEIRSFGN